MAETIDSGEADIALSAAAGWEIAIKQQIGRLTLEADLAEAAREFRELPITLAHATAAGQLPLHHRDPFDRILVAQAQLEGMTLVTSDSRLAAYDVHILSAS